MQELSLLILLPWFSMTETVVAPQIFSGASHFEITNSVFTASSNGTTLTSPIQPLSRTTLPASALETNRIQEESKSTLVESEVYARLLLPRKKGYPLWKPKPDERLPEEYRRVGARIGDIGILNDSGGFDYLFNACLSADHPVNAGRVPQDFIQLIVDDNDTVGSSREYRSGFHISSNPSQIHKTRIPSLPGQPQIPRVPKEVGAGISFHSSTTKGALLILPEGGMRIDHQQYTRFYKYAADCARSWYTYVNGSLARGAHNGSIYFVTGCDKARAWGMASFIDAHPESVSLDFVPSEPEKPGGPPEYWFSTCNSATSSSDMDDIFENQSGCVFLRGFKIALQIPLFMTSISIGSKVTDIFHLDADRLLPNTKSPTFSRSFMEWWFQRYMPSGLPSTGDNICSSEMDISLQTARYQVYHPSNIINEWILTNNDKVEVAITHDDAWASVIQDNEEEMPNDQELIRRIEEHFTLIKSDHYVHLTPQADSLHLNSSCSNLQILKRSHSDTSMVCLSRSPKRIIRQYASDFQLQNSQISGIPISAPFQLQRSQSFSTSSLEISPFRPPNLNSEAAGEIASPLNIKQQLNETESFLDTGARKYVKDKSVESVEDEAAPTKKGKTKAQKLLRLLIWPLARRQRARSFKRQQLEGKKELENENEVINESDAISSIKK